MLKVNELARDAGVSPHIVRYYTRVGLIKPARRDANGYKQFELADIKRLLFIRRARGLGFTIAEIAEILRMSRRRETPCPMVREIMERRFLETTGELEQIVALKQRIARALEQWRSMPDRVPTGDEICRLIETVPEGDAPPANAIPAPRRFSPQPRAPGRLLSRPKREPR